MNLDDVRLALGLELVFAGIVIALAGASDEMGRVVNFFLVGLWLVFMVAHPEVFARINESISAAARAGS